MLRIEVMMNTKTPVYHQQIPVGLYTYEELGAMGLRPAPGELPRALLKICTAGSECTTGVFGLDQAEPIVVQAVSA